MKKTELLRKHLVEETETFTEEELPLDSITETEDGIFEVPDMTFAVYTDEEADKKAAEDIQESLWAFNADFILDHSKLENYNEATISAFKKMQESLCEDANELVEAIINDMDEFVEDAISADGRGHFLNTYDNEENETKDDNGETFYIYRLN